MLKAMLFAVRRLLTHPLMNMQAIRSAITPTFRRQGLKKSPMIHVVSIVVGSVVFFGFDWWDLLSRRYAESSVSGMTIDQ